MPKRLAVIIAALALTLGGCSSSLVNSHPAPVPTAQPFASSVKVAMQGNFSPSTAGAYPLAITVMQNGNALAAGTTLAQPISLSSNDTTNVQFSTNTNGSAPSATLSFATVGQPVYLVWTPCATNCSTMPPSITVTATASGVSGSNVGTLNLSNNGSQTYTVSSVTLALAGGAPSVNASGVYPLTINAYSNGALIPASGSFQYPISLSSNASAYVGFSTSSSGANPSSTISVPNANTQVYLVYTACSGVSSCPAAPNTITVTGTGSGIASSGSLSFASPSNPVPSNPVVNTVTLALQGPAPDLTASGSYPLVLNAYSGGNLLPATATFQYPITLTSNATSYLTFSVNGAAPQTTVQVPNASSQVVVNYTVCTTSPCPPAPSSFVITASAPGMSADGSIPF